MTEILVGVQTTEGADGKTHQFSYYRLEDGRGYGICIRDGSGGVAMAPGVTTRRRKIDALLRRMVRGAVSPASMRDVVEDWLAE